ncbi:MAG TPA: caspase family protein [Anaeromyxobacter sp.]
MFLTALLCASFPAQADDGEPPVAEEYRRYFVHYADRRTMLEKVLNVAQFTQQDVGRSLALVAGVSDYPSLNALQRELRPAGEDLRRLVQYLRTQEFFDEVVVLKNEEVTSQNLEYFLQSYFPQRLRKFPKSRFLFAYSGHGFTDGGNGYLLKYTARHMNDKENSINLKVVKAWVNEVVQSGHQVLVLLNSCYGGSFVRTSFGPAPKRTGPYLPKLSGAHAITAGGTREPAWQDDEVGPGSVFFEKVLAGLGGVADTNGDGVITTYELFDYLRQEIRYFTDSRQNPQIGDLASDPSSGEFFFLNRQRQYQAGLVPAWTTHRKTSMGGDGAKELSEARKAYEAKDYVRAAELFAEAAHAGKAEACQYLGWMHSHGLGFPRSIDEALRWYRSGAANGDRISMVSAAVLDVDEVGTPSALDEAFRLFNKAAELGDAQSIYNVGRMYRLGLGVPVDHARAAPWFRKAASLNYPLAVTALGWATEWGLGVPKDELAARALYRRAIELGDESAEANLADMLTWSRGGPADPAEALRLMRSAAGKANTYAMRRVAEMYDPEVTDGAHDRFPKDEKEAVVWYRAAAAGSEGVAMRRLGLFHERGRAGLKIDYDLARTWYERAAAAGDMWGNFNLGIYYRDGWAGAPDAAQALKFFRRAAELGHPDAAGEVKRLEAKR